MTVFAMVLQDLRKMFVADARMAAAALAAVALAALALRVGGLAWLGGAILVIGPAAALLAGVVSAARRGR